MQHAALKKFINKHFDLPNQGEVMLDKAVASLITQYGEELEGMSEYELVELYDETLYQLGD